MPPLQTKNSIASLQQLYSTTDAHYNALVYGPSGTGKSYACSTLPKPILYFCFDPKGYKIKPLTDAMDRGEIILVDLGNENAAKPSMITTFQDVLNAVIKDGSIDKINTIVIDSLTTMCDAMMNQICKHAGIAIADDSGIGMKTPEIKQWGLQISNMRNVLKKVQSLPIHLVCLAHIESDKDEVSGKMHSALSVTKKLKVMLPLLFSECYVSQVKKKGVNKDGSINYQYSWLIANNGILEAKSRASSYGITDKEIPQDFKKIMDLGQYDTTDNVEAIKEFKQLLTVNQ